MGYYTYHVLDVYNEDGTDADVTIVDQWMTEQNEGAGWTPYQFKSTNDPSEDQRKWYEHEEDMKEISEAYPLLVFALMGWGEETADHWRQYFQNGEIIATEHLPEDMVWVGEGRPPWLT